LLDELHTWLQDTLANTAPGGTSAKALGVDAEIKLTSSAD
jgi:hypothetical protein